MSKEKYEKEIRSITEKLKKEYKPEKIILFGSLAYGKVKPSSDIDMLIVKKSKKRRIDRIKEILFMIDNNMPFDPLVYTPQELKKRLQLGDFFIQDILRRGVVLYEK